MASLNIQWACFVPKAIYTRTKKSRDRYTLDEFWDRIIYERLHFKGRQPTTSVQGSRWWY
jgi:hypothetical protein